MKQNVNRLLAFTTAGMMVLSAASFAMADELAAPQGVVINYGSVATSSEDDTVTFEAVPGAESYKVYVFQDGDTTAKVTQSTETTVALACPLDAGDYQVAVVAVAGEQASKPSGKVGYTVEAAQKIKLGQVSDIAIDFSAVDADNAVYPIVSFTGVENAGRYLVDIYAANASGEKQLTSLGYTTRLTVPAKQASGYMMNATNYADLNPGYYVVSVTAVASGDDYENGDPVEAFVAWTGANAIQPVIVAEEQENGGVMVSLDNYLDYNPGITLDVYVYADAACTQLVKQTTMTYSTSISFGTTNYSKSVSLEVKDAAEKDGDLAVGTEYYVVMSFDPEFYTGDYASAPVAFTCTKAGDGKAASAGGMMMGGGGGGASGWEVSPEAVSFDEGAETFAFTIGSQPFFNTTANVTDAADGDVWDYKLEDGDTAAPFDSEMILHLKDDGTALLTVSAAGPISDSRKTGTWAVDGGVITVNWD